MSHRRSRRLQRLLARSVNAVPWKLRERIRSMPGVAPLQRFLVGRLLSGATFDHRINAGPAAGLVCPVALPDDKLIWAGTYERSLASAICEAVRSGDVCFDVGSHHGFFAGVMALAGAGQVVCFEPLPANRERLERLRSLNPRLPLQIVPYALGGRSEESDFFVMPDSSMGKLASSDFQPDVRPDNRVPVSVRRLDDLVESGEVPSPDLLKVDVEGAELQVLQGAETVLSQRRPTLFLEAHSRVLKTECETFLAGLGYRVRILEGRRSSDGDAAEVFHLAADWPRSTVPVAG